MLRKHLCFLSAFLFLALNYVCAQQPDFTYERTDPGCPATLRINFTNASTGFSSAASYQWNFGNNKQSDKENPFTTYTDGGIYTVALAVTENGKSYVTTKEIIKYKNPVVDFTTGTATVCPNSAVVFTSNATPGDGVISEYIWEFDDGNTTNTILGTVTHQYQKSKTFSPGLSVTNNYGCITSVTKPNLVTVLKPPVVSFTTSAVSVCKEADPVIFTNTSSNATSFVWRFGDGSESAEENATHVYGQKGQFSVQLQATSGEGCTDTSKRTLITVASSHSDIKLPTLLCLNSNLLFKDNSNPVTANPVWLMDNDVAATSVHQFNTKLTDLNSHKLQLINVYGTCSDTATALITAQTAPVPSPFKTEILGLCGLPATVKVSDQGTGSDKWEWDFINTNEENFQPTDFTKTATHTYTAENTYYIKLRVTDPSGCSGEIRQPVKIIKNKTTIVSAAGIYGCKTLTTDFSATSPNPLATYKWTFSDDGSTSSEAAPHHTFTQKGVYTASLRTETETGCTDTALLKLFIGDVPSFNFEVTPNNSTVVCGNNKVTFTVTGTDAQGQFYWNFGDTKDFTLINGGGPNFTHKYKQDSVYTVSLAINNNGCTDTVVREKYITVLPPFPNITTLTYDCNDRTKVIIKEASSKTESYVWNFGDGTDTAYTTALPQLVHRYPGTGKYKILLTTSNGGCVVKDSLNAYVVNNQKPVLTSVQSALCINDSLLTTVSNMEASPYGYSANTKEYTVKSIEYQNKSPFTGSYSYPDATWQNPFHVNIKKLNPGEQNIRIITTSRGRNCNDTTNYIAVRINGPKAGFAIANQTICLSEKMIFTDTSKSDVINPIISREWDFGDGASQTLTDSGDVFHKFSNPGSYNIKLVVGDAENCSDTAFFTGNKIVIKGPKAQFSIAGNPILPNVPETFTNLTNFGMAGVTNNSYQWFFGDGESGAGDEEQVIHTYRQYGDDTVKLIAASSETTCSDTATDVVHVKNTNLSFTYTQTNLVPNSNCPPVRVNFTSTAVNFNAIGWDFGDGATADNINTPSHTYYKPGIYKVTIFGYYDAVTFDSSWEYITIIGPTAIVHKDISASCGAARVTFSAETKDATSLSWDFGDGILSSDSVVIHQYTQPYIYTPSLTVLKGDKCTNTYYFDTPVVIDSLHIAVDYDSVVQCHQLLVNFTTTIFSIAKNNDQKISYLWQSGSGNASSENETASFTYSQPGTYTASLVAASPYGCTDTATAEIIFTEKPFAVIKGPLEICENTPAVFTAVKTNNADILLYDWQFQNGVSDLQNPPPQLFTASGSDTVRLITDNKGCRDTLYQELIIHAQPDIKMLLSDSIVCLGDAIVFDAAPADGVLQEPVEYVWNLGNGISAAQKSASYVYSDYGTYLVTLTATSQFGCMEKVSNSVTISQSPKASIKAPDDICVNGTATFSGSSAIATAQYFWHFSDNTTSVLQNAPPKTYTTSGIDSCYLVAGIGGCRDTAYHSLHVHNLPSANILPQNPRICLGDSIQLTAHSGQTYQWQNATFITNNTVADPHVFPTANTKYTVQVTDGYGCKNLDSITVLVTQPQRVSVISPVNACAGSRVSLAASGTDNYHWINGDDLNNPNIAKPFTKDSAQNKTYIVVGSDEYGCFTDTSGTEVIVRSRPEVEAGSNITVPAGITAQLSAMADGNIVKWSWQPPLYLSCTDCPAPVSQIRQSTRYTAEATDIYGCKGTDTVLVTVVCKESLINIPQVFSPNGDGKNDRFGIAAPGVKTITHFIIFGRNGNKVWEKNNVNWFDKEASWDGMSNNFYMPADTYVYIIQAVCDAGEVYNLRGTVTLIR